MSRSCSMVCWLVEVSWVTAMSMGLVPSGLVQALQGGLHHGGGAGGVEVATCPRPARSVRAWPFDRVGNVVEL